MNTNMQKQGGEKLPVPGAASRSKALDIARELADIHQGQAAQEPVEPDPTKGRGESPPPPEVEAKTARLEFPSAFERLEHAAGRARQGSDVTGSVDEDDAGHSANARLVEESLAKAEKHRWLQAGKTVVEKP